MKLQVKAPPEELQSFKVASVFGSFTIQEPSLDGWSEATAEATLKPHCEASSDCPYCWYSWICLQDNVQSDTKPLKASTPKSTPPSNTVRHY
jgi:hypothetical protein